MFDKNLPWYFSMMISGVTIFLVCIILGLYTRNYILFVALVSAAVVRHCYTKCDKVEEQTHQANTETKVIEQPRLPYWQKIKCKDCGREYTRLPNGNYYESSCGNNDRCDSCMFTNFFAEPDRKKLPR